MPEIQCKDRDEWLRERRKLLTASDVSAVLGISPWSTPWDVYQEKVNGVQRDGNRAMSRGKRMEDAIAQEYHEETERPVVNLGEFTIQRHPDLEWLGATLDRDVQGSALAPAPEGTKSIVNPLEIKMALGSAAEWQDEPPLYYVVQLQVQISCVRADWGTLCALTGPGPLRHQDFYADPKFFAAALPILEEFWHRVKTQNPPEPQELPSTLATAKRVWPLEDGQTVQLSAELAAKAHRLDQVRRLQAKLKDHEEGLQGIIRAAIGSASAAALPDGSVLTLKNVHKDAYQVKEQDYRVLRHVMPRIGRTR